MRRKEAVKKANEILRKNGCRWDGRDIGSVGPEVKCIYTPINGVNGKHR